MCWVLICNIFVPICLPAGKCLLISFRLAILSTVLQIAIKQMILQAESASLENYMTTQSDITLQMRGILINWLIEVAPQSLLTSFLTSFCLLFSSLWIVLSHRANCLLQYILQVHYKFDLMPETLYLTVALLDRYVSLVPIKKTEFQLVGLASLLLASKYEDFWHPRVLICSFCVIFYMFRFGLAFYVVYLTQVKDLISISAETYTRKQVLEMVHAGFDKPFLFYLFLFLGGGGL